MQLRFDVLGQLFLFACVLATLSIAGIFFVLFGPVPGKRSVAMVPRFSVPVQMAPMPSLAAQVAPVDSLFAPQPVFTPPVAEPPVAVAVPPPVAAAPVRKPKGAKVQPLPRKRAANGTASPFAPVVRSAQRQVREEDAVTNPVPLFDSEEMTRVDDPFSS